MLLLQAIAALVVNHLVKILPCNEGCSTLTGGRLDWTIHLVTACVTWILILSNDVSGAAWMRLSENGAVVRQPSISLVSRTLTMQDLAVNMRHACCGFSSLYFDTESDAMTSTFGCS